MSFNINIHTKLDTLSLEQAHFLISLKNVKQKKWKQLSLKTQCTMLFLYALSYLKHS